MDFSIFNILCNHNHYLFQNIPITTKRNLIPLSSYYPFSSLSPHPPALRNYQLTFCLFGFAYAGHFM